MNEQQLRCDLCGRIIASDKLMLFSRTGQYLCKDCLAEEQSCGCADEEEGYPAGLEVDRKSCGGGREHS